MFQRSLRKDPAVRIGVGVGVLFLVSAALAAVGGSASTAPAPAPTPTLEPRASVRIASIGPQLFSPLLAQTITTSQRSSRDDARATAAGQQPRLGDALRLCQTLTGPNPQAVFMLGTQYVVRGIVNGRADEIAGMRIASIGEQYVSFTNGTTIMAPGCGDLSSIAGGQTMTSSTAQIPTQSPTIVGQPINGQVYENTALIQPPTSAPTASASPQVAPTPMGLPSTTTVNGQTVPIFPSDVPGLPPGYPTLPTTPGPTVTP